MRKIIATEEIQRLLDLVKDYEPLKERPLSNRVIHSARQFSEEIRLGQTEASVKNA